MNPDIRHSAAGRAVTRLFLVFGALGILTGAIPYGVNLGVLLAGGGYSGPDLFRHGPVAMGLGLGWALLSSAQGTALGGMLFAAGLGRRRGRAWAAPLAVASGINGILITGTDLALFLCRARPGSMRTLMLGADSAAFLVAAATLTWTLFEADRNAPAHPPR